jgi:hypothetical protein
LFLVPTAVFAQGSLTGTVKDSSGAVLPGVTVEAASPALIEKVRSTVTDGEGLYRIVDLRPGTYTITATLPGFTTVKREGVVLAGSQTLTIPLEMKVGELQETITVSGETPVVDVQNTRRETVISSDVISQLPVTRAYGSLLNVTPGLTVDNNGLAATPTMTFFSAHGGATNEGRMMINGMTVAAAFNGGGVSSLTYDTNNVDEVAITVSGGLGESETGGPSMNIVPRSGGNTFRGQAFYNTAGKWSTGNNIDADLEAIGLTTPPAIINAWDASASYGGPIKRDRLWFYGAVRKFSTAQQLEGVGVNAFAGDASHWDFQRDDSIETRNVQGRDIFTVRFTGQVTPKNRLTFSQENQYRCEGSTLTSNSDGCRKREADWIALGSNTQSPEANTGYFDFPYWVTQATWTSPITNKVLLEAGYSRFAYEHAGGPGQLPPDGIFNLIPVTERQAIDGHRANFNYRGLGSYLDNYGNPNSWRASASYVTGAHNLKVGYQGAYLIAKGHTVANDPLMTYRFNNRQPDQFTVRLQDWRTNDVTESAALFVQDTWTKGKLTVQGALRYDRAWSFSPAADQGTSTITPYNAAPITFARTEGINAYNDISPRVGVAYDVFGKGKTAVKFNFGRYLAPATNDQNYPANNPANRIRTTLSRSWTDGNGNFAVDCNILDPVAQNNLASGGDNCGAIGGADLNFGKPNITSEVDPGVLGGWGIRPVDYQYGINVQQQLAPRVSLNVGYNRRWWGNFTVTDNTLVSPSDYEKWTITAPTDSRLPNGGGYPIDVYTITPAGNAAGSFNRIVLERTLGEELGLDLERTRYWHGVDVDVNARLKGGLFLQAGTTTGRMVQDTCATVAVLDNPDPRNCHSVDPFETTLRGSATYTVPKIDVLVSATMRSQPALLVNTTWLVPNTCTGAGCLSVQNLLGRIPPGGVSTGTTTVNPTDSAGPNRLYADSRRNQIDMRFAKVFRFGGRRADVGVDLTNLLNTNYATAYEGQFGASFLNPTSILAPRFVRLNFTFNF